MSRKYVVITGGASGLGLGCVTGFRKLGFDVTIADVDLNSAQRALEQVRRLDGPATVHAELLDLAEPASIEALGQRLEHRGRPIDVLVNNAGIYPPARRRLSAEGHELSFAIGHLGHFRLTHRLWPLLERAPAARVVSVSSLVQRRADLDLNNLAFDTRYEPILAYRHVKLACLIFALELQRRLDAAGSPISSYAAHPGVCRSQLGSPRKRSAQDTLWQRLSTAAMAHGMRIGGQSPENGARSVVEAATSNQIPKGAFVGPTWMFESFGPPRVVQPGRAACDRALAEQLWFLSEQLTGVTWSL